MNRKLSFAFCLVALGMLLGGAPLQARETIVTPGDTLRITVPGDPVLSQQVAVTEEGKITLPHLGPVAVKGLTTSQIQQKLVTLLSKFYKSPSVLVELAGSAREQVLVYGAVRGPGTHELKTADRLLDVVARAGGLQPNADKEKATLMRQGVALPMSLNLDAIYKGDLTQNIELKNGDTLFVPEQKQAKIKVMGEVMNSPTEILFRDDLTLAEAVSYSGGFRPTADKERVRIIHKDLKTEEVNLDDPLAIQSTKLTEGDVVFVPNNEENKVSILGGVNTPGKYPLKPGMTLTDVIAAAGGFKDTGRVKRDEIKVARVSGAPVVVDIDRYFKGDLTQNLVLERGDTILVDEKAPAKPRQRRSIGDMISGVLLPAATLFYYLGR